MVVADVAVVGAGPAGSAAALTLARAGRDVVVVDRARFPRDKCCGDGLTAMALRRLEHLGLDPADVPGWRQVGACWIRSPSGRTVRFPLPAGRGQYAAVAPRAALDAALADLVRSAGAKVLDGAALVGARSLGDRVVLEVDGVGEVQARYAVGADGAWSPLRRALGAGGARELGEWHAFRGYVATPTGPAATEMFVWFEPDLLPGYAWSFPLGDGRANVGFGVRREPGVRTGHLGRVWPDLLARRHVADALGAAPPAGPPRAWPIPAHVDRVLLSRGRALFVGDAAAATDVMTGEGIGQALLTGAAAAEALLEAGPHDPYRAATNYAGAVARELVADHRLAALLSRALRHRRGARVAVRAAGATGWTRRNFARWLFEDYPRAYVATPGRWREHSLAGAGAFGVGPTPREGAG